MAYDYNAIIVNTVIPQIRDKGVDTTLTRVETVTATWTKKFDNVTFVQYWENNSTGDIVYTEPSGGTTTTTVKCVVTDFTEEERRDTSILVDDKKLLTIEMPEPKQGDRYTINDTTFQYVNHETIAPGGTVVLYKIQVRV